MCSLREQSLRRALQVKPGVGRAAGESTMTTLRKQVSEALRAQGFRRRGGVHLHRIGSDVSLWVDVGAVGPRTDIAPSVGVRSESVGALMAQLSGLTADEWQSTIAINVGYALGRGYASWQVGAEVDEILSTVLAALDRLRVSAGSTALSQMVAIPEVAALPHYRHALVAMALIAGDAPQALGHLGEARREFCAEPDSVCDDFRAFEQRVNQHLAAMAVA